MLSPAVSTAVFKIPIDYDLQFGLPATVGVWNSSWTGPAFTCETSVDIHERMNNVHNASPFYNGVSHCKNSYVDLQYNKKLFIYIILIFLILLLLEY